MSADDPVVEAVKVAWREHPEMFEHHPCAREHVPGRACLLAEGHDPEENGTGWVKDYERLEEPEDFAWGTTEPAVVGSFVVRSAVLPVGERQYPALVFDFTAARGRRMQPVLLVLDEDDMEGVGRLIANAGHGAIGAARQAEGRDPKTGRRTS